MGGREENKDLHMVLRVSLQGSPRRSAHHREVSGALQTTLQHTPRKDEVLYTVVPTSETGGPSGAARVEGRGG